MPLCHTAIMPIDPIDFSHLRGNLTGISDRALDAHIEIYRGHVDTLNTIEREYQRVDWTKPTNGQGPAPEGVRDLLGMRIGDLRLKPEGMLKDLIDIVNQELQAAGISFQPGWYLGDDGLWTADRATSINIPWFLANPAVWWLVNDRTIKYTAEEIARALRHEAGHAINYAFELWKRPDWLALFGDFTLPYKDTYLSDPTSKDFVQYLHRTGDKHYAQKHPDEDWAETFATWLDPRSGTAVVPGPLAKAKIAYVEALNKAGDLSGDNPNKDGGIRSPYTKLTQTIGQYMGEEKPNSIWSPFSELHRREPHAYNAVVLHETYFGGMGPSTLSGPGPILASYATTAYGSVDSWLMDLRTTAGSTDGWAITVVDQRRSQIRNVLVEDHNSGIPAGCPIILACDVWGHAYQLDHGTRKDIGIAAWLQNVNWDLVEVLLAASLDG